MSTIHSEHPDASPALSEVPDAELARTLAKGHCRPCAEGTPALSAERAAELLRGLVGGERGWAIVEGHHLRREFAFANFVEAVDFVQALTPIAEAEAHHPDLELGWGRVVVNIHTHTVGGLSENDFILAAQLDALAAGGQ